MFTPINPEQERIRALNVVSALTEHDRVVDLFAPNARPEEKCDQVETPRRPRASANRSHSQSIVQVFKAIHAELLVLLKL